MLDRVAAAARCSGTWCVHVGLRFPAPLDAERLARASSLLAEAEPVLGCRLVDGARAWETLPDPPLYVARGDHDALVCEPLDLEAGPPVRIAHDGDRLLVTASHAATDGGGMVHLLGRLAAIYRALRDDPDHRPAVSEMDRGLDPLWRALPWKLRLAALSNAGDRLQTLRRAFPSHQLRIPVDGRTTETRFLVRELPSAPLVAWARARGGTVNDLLQAAMLRALVAVEPWDGTTALTVNSTVDLRRYLPGGRAAAVCNLSTGTLVTLGRELGADLADTLGRVAAVTAAQKARGRGLGLEVVGLPLLSWVPYARLEAGVRQALDAPRDGRRPADSISNVGAIDPAWIAFDAPPVALDLRPQFLHPSRYQLASYAFGGTTRLVSAVWPSAAREERVRALLATPWWPRLAACEAPEPDDGAHAHVEPRRRHDEPSSSTPGWAAPGR
ncbi:MAG: hypothetical protein R3F59_18050 [Myxococcota bacterium]